MVFLLQLQLPTLLKPTIVSAYATFVWPMVCHVVHDAEAVWCTLAIEFGLGGNGIACKITRIVTLGFA